MRIGCRPLLGHHDLVLAFRAREGFPQKLFVLDHDFGLAARTLHAKWDHGDFETVWRRGQMIVKRLRFILSFLTPKKQNNPRFCQHIGPFWSVWDP
jgi:hypothetical protein